MPPKKRRAAAVSSTPRKRRSTRRRSREEDDIPEIFQEMLAEVVAEETNSSKSIRPAPYIGRRKASEEPLEEVTSDPESRDSPVPQQPELTAPITQLRSLQTIYDDFEDSEDEDVEFEDVDLDNANQTDENPQQKSLQLDLSTSIATPRRPLRRRIATSAERRLRTDVHKAHILLLLSAVQHRNRWCESEQVQAILKPLVSRKTISLLHINDSKPQYERSYSFMKGVEELCGLWRASWTITARGMKRALWRDNIDLEKESDLSEDAIDFDDFNSAAQTRSGSRDLGAQLFCALLRSLAIDTRLVCSLQVLPFSAVAKGESPAKTKPASSYTHASTQDYGSSSSRSRNKIAESPYPVFWVEVYAPATSTWIPLDPLVRNTMNKARTAFEPPSTDALNSFSYVIAFDDDGTAKDVTRRYNSHFNAKTRKTRIESTKGGEEWWSRVMSFFEKPLPEVRDELEDAEFLRRAETEGMPKNVADFKGHPVYVLERHLRRNEVLWPRREVGKVTVGAGEKKKLEGVFRRRDVHACRTSEGWYRRGRDVRVGMEPLKYAQPRTRLEREEVEGEGDDEGLDGAGAGMALYAIYQTEVYVPPSVEGGRVPRNKFGNLDVYVDSMIPPGGIHVRHPLAKKAAEVLGIDHADAVTGFEFRGRQGTAVVDGVVVAEDQRVAVVAVIVGLQTQILEEVQEERSRISLAVWKKWLHALKVRERIEREYGHGEDKETPQKNTIRGRRGGEDDDDDDSDDDDNQDATFHDDDDDDEDAEYEGGGFMPDPDALPSTNAKNQAVLADANPILSSKGKKTGIPPLPPIPAYHQIIVIESPHKPSTSTVSHSLPDARSKGKREKSNGTLTSVQDNDEVADLGGGGFLPDGQEEDQAIQTRSGTKEQYDEVQDDGSDGDEGEGGGFLPDEEEDMEGKDHQQQDTSGARTGRNSVTITDFQSTITVPEASLVSKADSKTNSTTDNAAHGAYPEKSTTANAYSTSHAEAAEYNLRAEVTAARQDTAEARAGDARAEVGRDTTQDDLIPPPSSNNSSRSKISETSMLSHDPEEEDAEPEWLLDSLS